jgi:predicted alpha/beta-hydrolase family hydrolase
MHLLPSWVPSCSYIRQVANLCSRDLPVSSPDITELQDCNFFTWIWCNDLSLLPRPGFSHPSISTEINNKHSIANMPPKKRKTTESTSAPEPTKRVTRSSTKADKSTEQAPAESSNPAKKPSKAPKAAPKSQTTKAKSAPLSPTKADVEEEDINTPANISTLSITSEHTKSPTQCAIYSAATSSPILIFTHGAGGTLSAPAVMNFCTGFSEILPVLVFQGSMNLGSRVKGFNAGIEHIRNEQEGKRMMLGGRSMGARAAVMAGSDMFKHKEKAELLLILVSYPLQGPKDVRDQILLDLPASVRVLFVVSDRDAMCPLDMLDGVRNKMSAKSQVVVVRGADHGMHVKPKKLEREVGEETGRVAASWVGGNVADEVTYLGEEE